MPGAYRGRSERQSSLQFERCALHAERLMGCRHHDSPIFAVFLYLPAKTCLAFRIDGRKRLVHQPKRSRHDQEACECQAPPLTVGKIPCGYITQMTEIQSFQGIFGFARTAIVSAMKQQIFEQGQLTLYAVLVAKPSDCADTLLGKDKDVVRTHAK